jgi:hypothetical protein
MRVEFFLAVFMQTDIEKQPHPDRCRFVAAFNRGVTVLLLECARVRKHDPSKHRKDHFSSLFEWVEMVDDFQMVSLHPLKAATTKKSTVSQASVEVLEILEFTSVARGCCYGPFNAEGQILDGQ